MIRFLFVLVELFYCGGILLFIISGLNVDGFLCFVLIWCIVIILLFVFMFLF